VAAVSRAVQQPQKPQLIILSSFAPRPASKNVTPDNFGHDRGTSGRGRRWYHGDQKPARALSQSLCQSV